ncbi:hypothetical protein Tco_0144113, partial [Tanacetum coccineum]
MSQINSECLFFDDTDDETEVNSLLSGFLIDAALVIQASTPTIQKYQRSHMVRDRYGAHDRLVLAYFAKKPFYNAYLFRKRFRMNRSLFTRIVRDLSANCPYFQEGCDAVGKAGISALVKCTSAIRQLAYAALYGEEYLRRPTQTDVEKLYAFHENKHGFPARERHMVELNWKRRSNICIGNKTSGGEKSKGEEEKMVPAKVDNMMEGLIKWLTPLPLETKVKGSILTPYKARGPFLPLVESEAASLPLVGVGLSTSQPPPYTVEDDIKTHNLWKTVLGVTYLLFYLCYRLYETLVTDYTVIVVALSNIVFYMRPPTYWYP